MDFMRSFILSLVLFAACAECAAQDISKIDRNFEPRKIGNVEFRFYNAKNAPFKVEGMPWRKEGGAYSRLPDGVTKDNASPGVVGLCNHASGAAIRFATLKSSTFILFPKAVSLPFIPSLRLCHIGHPSKSHAKAVRQSLPWTSH